MKMNVENIATIIVASFTIWVGGLTVLECKTNEKRVGRYSYK